MNPFTKYRLDKEAEKRENSIAKLEKRSIWSLCMQLLHLKLVFAVWIFRGMFNICTISYNKPSFKEMREKNVKRNRRPTL